MIKLPIYSLIIKKFRTTLMSKTNNDENSTGSDGDDKKPYSVKIQESHHPFLKRKNHLSRVFLTTNTVWMLMKLIDCGAIDHYVAMFWSCKGIH